MARGRRAYDLVVVGMGSGGIPAAELAAGLGLRVAAVERARVGGDCLWTGCVPSKALLASARAAQAVREAGRYGVEASEPDVDTARVWECIRAVQDEIAAAEDDPARLAELGIHLRFGAARLAGPRSVQVGEDTLETRFVLVVTGSRPAAPDVPGLAEAGFLTSETVFERDHGARSLLVVGGGPVGVELAQAHRRLGCEVTLLQRGPRLLPRDEPELVETLTARLRDEGVRVATGATIERVGTENGTKVVQGSQDGAPVSWEAEEILVATGRLPNVEGLGLAEAGVRVGPRGIVVDRRLRTSARSVYAAGDVVGRFRFTHSAAYEAVIAVRNMFFPGFTRAPELVPWCTFTEPELAHVGLTTAQAIDRHGTSRVRVHRASLRHSDRARADGTTEGAILLVTVRGRVVGAHVLAPSAGEIIHELALLVAERRKLLDLAGFVHVYPTLSTSVNLIVAEAAFELAGRFGWLARRRQLWPW